MRRRTLITGILAGGAALAAGLYRFTGLLSKHYRPTPYDDLLARLTDREQAIRLGTKVRGNFDPGPEAAQLRTALQNKSLGQAAASDIAAGRMAEIDGWVLPQTVARMAALAARA